MARSGEGSSASDQVAARENTGLGLVELFMHDLACAILRRFLRDEIAILFLDRNALDVTKGVVRKFHQIEAYAQRLSWESATRCFGSLH